MRIKRFLLVSLLVALVLAACGGDGGAPVEMKTYESGAVTIEYPDAWDDSGMDLMGMTMAIFSPMELDAESLLSLEDPTAMLGDDPLSMLIVVPEALAGDLGFDIDELEAEFIPEEEGVDIVKQGDVEISGVTGKEVVAKGPLEEVGGQEVGVHLAAAEKDDGTVIIFVGMTPEKDLDKNLDIFDYMLKSVELK